VEQKLKETPTIIRSLKNSQESFVILFSWINAWL